MALFGRTRAASPSQAELSAWRGRSRDISDAGTLPWQTLFAALEAADAADPNDDLPTAALGLRAREFRGEWSDVETTRLSGVRHGRQVEIRLGGSDHGWSSAGAMVVWVRAAMPDFQALGSRAGTFAVDPGAPPAALGTLIALTPQPEVWNDVLVRGGAEGLVTHRKITARANPRGYLYALWLLERLADTFGAAALPPVDITALKAPYRMG